MSIFYRKQMALLECIDMKKRNSNIKANLITTIRTGLGSSMAVVGAVLFIAAGKTHTFDVSNGWFILAIALVVGGIAIAKSVALSDSITRFFMR
jgi:hypothetical protein